MFTPRSLLRPLALAALAACLLAAAQPNRKPARPAGKKVEPLLSFTTEPYAAPLDLTATGTADWYHFGEGGPDKFNRKADPRPDLKARSVILRLHGNQPQKFDDGLFPISWSDGTPEKARTVLSGLYVGGVDNGFDLELPGSTRETEARVYVGTFGAAGRMRIQLADASTYGFNDTHWSSEPNQKATAVYIIRYRTASDDIPLLLEWRHDRDTGPTGGNVTLQAVTLKDLTRAD